MEGCLAIGKIEKVKYNMRNCVRLCVEYLFNYWIGVLMAVYSRIFHIWERRAVISI